MGERLQDEQQSVGRQLHLRVLRASPLWLILGPVTHPGKLHSPLDHVATNKAGWLEVGGLLRWGGAQQCSAAVCVIGVVYMPMRATCTAQPYQTPG